MSIVTKRYSTLFNGSLKTNTKDYGCQLRTGTLKYLLN